MSSSTRTLDNISWSRVRLLKLISIFAKLSAGYFWPSAMKNSSHLLLVGLWRETWAAKPDKISACWDLLRRSGRNIEMISYQKFCTTRLLFQLMSPKILIFHIFEASRWCRAVKCKIIQNMERWECHRTTCIGTGSLELTEDKTTRPGLGTTTRSC